MGRFVISQERTGLLARLLSGRGELAYMSIGVSGLCAEIEFPSDWHDRPWGWVRIGVGLARVGVAFPWHRVVPDEGQCSGPTYGFVFFGDGLHLHWGKCKGRRSDPLRIVQMPWGWRFREHHVLTEPETHPYRYVLRSGEVQERAATIYAERRIWTRPWLPWRMERVSIDVSFSDEVGERTGSWKGGTIGCGYDMLPGERPLDTLRRMERNRKFDR